MSIQIPITRGELETKRAQAAAMGFALKGDSGEAEYRKIKVGYSYDGNVLVINVLSKPFIYPESEVESRIKAWFA